MIARILLILLLASPASAATRLWVNNIEVTVDAGDGARLQQVLIEARDGDLIELEGGTVIVRTSSLMLPMRANAVKPVVIQTRNLATFAPAGTRIDRSHGPHLAEIRSTATFFNLVQTTVESRWWTLRGLRIRTLVEGYSNWAAVAIGTGAPSPARSVEHIELDRILIDLDDVQNPTFNYQIVLLFGRHLWMHHSHVSGVVSAADGDYSAVWVGFSPGPVLVEDNYLESGGETVFVGGGNFGNNVQATPTDVTVRRNHITFNVAWRGKYQVKNLFEAKQGVRLRLEGNLFTNQWVGSQVAAIVLSLRSEMHCATCPPSEPNAELTDVVVRNNIMKGGSSFLAASGIDASGWTLDPVTGGAKWPATDLTIDNNLVIGLDPDVWGAGNYITGSFQAPYRRVTVTHNTIFTKQAYGWSLAAIPTLPRMESFVWMNNVMSWAVTCFSEQRGSHLPALVLTTNDDRVVRGNVWGEDGADHGMLQSLNRYGDSQAFIAAQFTPEYRVKTDSPYRATGTDGKDLGADIGALQLAVGPLLWQEAGFGALPIPPRAPTAVTLK